MNLAVTLEMGGAFTGDVAGIVSCTSSPVCLPTPRFGRWAKYDG